MSPRISSRNPPWNRDETILALDLLLSLTQRNVTPTPTLPEVKALSALLRDLPYHARASRKEDFRNANGVALKLFNLRAASGYALGSGMRHSSLMDRRIWAEFSVKGHNAEEIAKRVKIAADSIRNALASYDFEEQVHGDTSEDEEFSEGLMVALAHKRRERSSALRSKFLEKRKRQGLTCEICGIGAPAHPQGDSIFEVHHLIPLSGSTEIRKTKMTDLALLCANCHRLIHRLIAAEGSWFYPEDVKKMLGFKLNE